MEREIILIDEEKCNGCGICIPACPEGALQIIDNKARLVSDLMCDGLGACIGECPEGAITIETREAEAYNELAVIKEIIKHGENTVIAHLKHLDDHGETVYFSEAIGYLESVAAELEFDLNAVLLKVTQVDADSCATGGCPGSAPMDFRIDMDQVETAGHAGGPAATGSAALAAGTASTVGTAAISGSDMDKQQVTSQAPEMKSELRQWPVQMHLINPNAPYFREADIVLAADCVPFTVGDFHNKFLKNKSLAIGCPKLDQGIESYIEKVTAMIDEAHANTLHVIVMEVPCCSGLVQIAERALDQASRKIPLKVTVVGVRGDILDENWA